LKQAGAPLAGFCATEPGGSANIASPPPGEGVRTTARFSGDRLIIQGRKSWISSATGWDRKGADRDHALPLERLPQDALAFPVFGGGNDSVRRRRLHAILQRPEYDPLAACSQVEV
jgi:alkylation response protein AidB-like acyl-CoA dehydrogenase